LHLREHRAPGHEVQVRVDEAGSDRSAVRVEDAGPWSREGAHLVIGAHGEDAVLAPRDRLRLGMRGIAGPHVRVQDDAGRGASGRVTRSRRRGAGEHQR
jgi:hypothetical protein